MYFIEHFLDLANKEGYGEYVRMIQRDIIRVVDAVAPDDGSGAANVKVVRKVRTIKFAVLVCDKRLTEEWKSRFCKHYNLKTSSIERQ